MIKLEQEILSKKGNKIQLFRTTPEKNGKNILFIGVFHGDEPEGEFLVKNLMAEIKDNEGLNNNILFIPCLNPDGKELNTRGNSNGVDLNRNFPTQNWVLSCEKGSYFSGETPASEIETRFIIDILAKFCPDLIITLHTPYGIINYDGPAKEIAEDMARLNNYPVQSDIGYPTPGSFGTYAGIERNIPTITLELPENIDVETLWQQNKSAFLTLINK